MHAFALDPDMLTLAGVFYPTGYVFAMFPTEQDARSTAEALERDSLSEKPVMLLSPQQILEQVVRTVGSADVPCPRQAPKLPPCANTLRWQARATGLSWCMRQTPTTPRRSCAWCARRPSRSPRSTAGS